MILFDLLTMTSTNTKTDVELKQTKLSKDGCKVTGVVGNKYGKHWYLEVDSRPTIKRESIHSHRQENDEIIMETDSTIWHITSFDTETSKNEILELLEKPVVIA